MTKSQFELIALSIRASFPVPTEYTTALADHIAVKQWEATRDRLAANLATLPRFNRDAFFAWSTPE